jgi:hypothetical protein
MHSQLPPSLQKRMIEPKAAHPDSLPPPYELLYPSAPPMIIPSRRASMVLEVSQAQYINYFVPDQSPALPPIREKQPQPSQALQPPPIQFFSEHQAPYLTYMPALKEKPKRHQIKKACVR